MNNVYTYVYLDPRFKDNSLAEYGIFELPIYIGIGTNGRLNDHLIFAKKGKNKRSYHINKLCKMLKEGYEPKIVKIKENQSLIEAKNLEIELIAKIGTAKVVEGVKRGPLTNLTRGGDGMNGYVHDRTNYNHSKHNLGKIGMHKNDLRIMVEEKDLQNYLDDEWIIGFGDKVKSNGTKGSIWMTNGTERKVIKDQTQIETLISLGWKFGYALENKKNTSAGKVSIFKGGVYKQVDKEKLDSFLETGWIKKSPLANRKKISKNGITKTVKAEELNQFIYDGWIQKGSK